MFYDKKPLESKPEKEQFFKNALKSADEHLATSKFFAGDALSLADLSVLGSLAFAEATDYDLSPYTNVQRWRKDAIAALPFYDELAKPSIEQLRGFIGFMKSQCTA